MTMGVWSLDLQLICPPYFLLMPSHTLRSSDQLLPTKTNFDSRVFRLLHFLFGIHYLILLGLLLSYLL